MIQYFREILTGSGISPDSTKNDTASIEEFAKSNEIRAVLPPTRGGCFGHTRLPNVLLLG